MSNKCKYWCDNDISVRAQASLEITAKDPLTGELRVYPKDVQAMPVASVKLCCPYVLRQECPRLTTQDTAEEAPKQQCRGHISKLLQWCQQKIS